jgi:hypothetical protein
VTYNQGGALVHVYTDGTVSTAWQLMLLLVGAMVAAATS